MTNNDKLINFFTMQIVKAENALTDWKAVFDKDPEYAFRWSDYAIGAAAIKRDLKLIVEDLEKGRWKSPAEFIDDWTRYVESAIDKTTSWSSSAGANAIELQRMIKLREISETVKSYAEASVHLNTIAGEKAVEVQS